MVSFKEAKKRPKTMIEWTINHFLNGATPAIRLRAWYWYGARDRLKRLEKAGVFKGRDRRTPKVYQKILRFMHDDGIVVLPALSHHFLAADKWKSYLVFRPLFEQIKAAYVPLTFLVSEINEKRLLALDAESKYIFGDQPYSFVYKPLSLSGGRGLKFCRIHRGGGKYYVQVYNPDGTERRGEQEIGKFISKLKADGKRAKRAILQAYSPVKDDDGNTYDIRLLFVKNSPTGYMRINTKDLEISNIKSGGEAHSIRDPSDFDKVPVNVDVLRYHHHLIMKQLDTIEGDPFPILNKDYKQIRVTYPEKGMWFFGGIDLGFGKMSDVPVEINEEELRGVNLKIHDSIKEWKNALKGWRDLVAADAGYENRIPVLFEVNTVPGVEGLHRLSKNKKVGIMKLFAQSLNQISQSFMKR
jgi:hypothetical protein